MSGSQGRVPVPSHVPSPLVRSVDIHYGEEFLLDPYRAWDAVMTEGPVLYSDTYGGFWIFTDPSMVRDVFQQPGSFHNSPLGIPVLPAWPRPLIPAELEPPAHTEFRQLLAPWFSTKAVGPLEDSIRLHARRLLADATAHAATGPVDFVGAVSQPLAGLVLGELFALEPVDLPRLAGWIDQSIHSTDADEQVQAGAAMVGYLNELIAERARHPGEDLVSAVLLGQVQGRSVTADEALDIIMLIIGAGLDTVVSTFAGAVLHIAEHPDDLHRLRSAPELVPTAVEEFLRVRPQALPARWVTRDMVFHGIKLAKGDRILAPLCCLTRNSSEFERAEEVVLDRENNRHAAFGLGIRRCLGAHLARLELKVGLEELLGSWQSWRTAGPEAVSYRAGTTIGLRHLMLLVQPNNQTITRGEI